MGTVTVPFGAALGPGGRVPDGLPWTCPTGPILPRPAESINEGRTAAASGGGDLEEKPTAAYVLSLIAGIFLLLGAQVAVLAIVGLLGLVFAALIIMGAMKLNSRSPGAHHLGHRHPRLRYCGVRPLESLRWVSWPPS